MNQPPTAQPSPAPQPKNFFWYDGREVQGPITGIEVRELALQGKILPATPVQMEGHDKWVEARRLKGLFDAQGRVLPPPASEGASEVSEGPPEPPSPPPAAPVAKPVVTEPPPGAATARWRDEHAAPASGPTAAVPPALPPSAPSSAGTAPLAAPVVAAPVMPPAVRPRPARRMIRPSADGMNLPGSLVATVIDWTRGLYGIVGGFGGSWRAATFLWALTAFSALPYVALQSLSILLAWVRVKREIPAELSSLLGGMSTVSVMTPIVMLGAGVVCLFFGHYILQRMASVGEQVVSASYKISTTAPYDCAAAVAVLIGLMCFCAGIWLLILKTPLTICITLLVIGPGMVVVAAHLLNLDEIGLVVDARARLSDDTLGFIAFLLKVGYLAVPSFVGLFCALATGAYILGCVGTLTMLIGSRDGTMMMLAQGPYALWIPLFCLAVLPLLAFVMAAAYALLLDLARSVLDLGAQARKGD